MAKNKKSKNIDGNLLNSEAGVKNLLLNVIIFVLLAIVIFLFYIFFSRLSGTNVEQKKNITQKFVPTEMIQVEVLNGCGVSGLADIFKDFLRKKNIDVVSSGNYTNFDVEQTIIIDRIGNKKKAEFVAELLGVARSRIITRINKDYFLDVSIVLGRDYLTLKPLR
jgi:hypothetical protein